MRQDLVSADVDTRRREWAEGLSAKGQKADFTSAGWDDFLRWERERIPAPKPAPTPAPTGGRDMSSPLDNPLIPATLPELDAAAREREYNRQSAALAPPQAKSDEEQEAVRAAERAKYEDPEFNSLIPSGDEGDAVTGELARMASLGVGCAFVGGKLWDIRALIK
jgi:hypothetical protein